MVVFHLYNNKHVYVCVLMKHSLLQEWSPDHHCQR